MEPWHWAVLLKPLATSAFFAIVVIPLELLLRKIWPESRVKSLLFDRTFRDRHPGTFVVVWLVLIVLLVCFVAWVGNASAMERGLAE